MATTDLERLARARRLISDGDARRLRLEADMSLAEVGAACGIGPGTVWKWETGARRPRHGQAVLQYVDVLDRLAALAVSTNTTQEAA